jgi:hypothetical protein
MEPATSTGSVAGKFVGSAGATVGAAEPQAVNNDTNKTNRNKYLLLAFKIFSF